MADLHFAADFSIPAEAVTQTFAILAKRGVGKTYTASVLVEELLKAGLHAVVVDPIGVWWGLRASADGKRPTRVNEDARHCLDLATIAEIVKCAEPYRY